MKCPKCGFNSFEHLSNCKRCNTDLTAFKQSFGIQAVILPAVQFRTPRSEAAADELALAPTAADEETFTWSSAAATPTEESASFPTAEAAADEFDFSDAVPTSGFAAHPTETFGEFSFDDQPASASVAATAEPDSAATRGDSNEFSATDLPEFTTGADVTSLDDVFKQEEAKPHQQQTPPGDDLFDASAFADLFKDEEQAK
jgi:hypothetical protein